MQVEARASTFIRIRWSYYEVVQVADTVCLSDQFNHKLDQSTRGE